MRHWEGEGEGHGYGKGRGGEGEGEATAKLVNFLSKLVSGPSEGASTLSSDAQSRLCELICCARAGASLRELVGVCTSMY